MRKWLYKKNVEPTIFTGEEAIQEALKSGWKPRPIGSTTPADTLEAEVVKEPKNIVETVKKTKSKREQPAEIKQVG